MDEKKLAIILGTAGVLLLILILLLMPGKRRVEPSRQPDEHLLVKKGQKLPDKPSDAYPGRSPSGSSVSAGSSGSGADSSRANIASEANLMVKTAGLPDHQAFTDDKARDFRQNREDARNRNHGNDSAGSGSSGNSGNTSVSSSANSQQGSTKVITGAKTTGSSSSSSGGSSGSSGQAAGRKNTGDAITFGRSDSSGAADNRGPEMVRQTFSEEDMKEFRQKREEIRSRIYEKKKTWVSAKAGDSSLTAKTRAKYRLKMIEGLRSGNEAMRNKNYAEAIKAYMAGIKDPDADPITQFTCFDQMRMAAKMIKDYDLYVEILKEQGELIEEEDLGILGIEKSKMGRELYESRRRYVQAIKDPAGVKKSVDEIMTKNGLKEEDREDTEKKFREDLAEWQAEFDQTG